MGYGVEQSHYFPVILLEAWAGCVTERVRKESTGGKHRRASRLKQRIAVETVQKARLDLKSLCNIRQE